MMIANADIRGRVKEKTGRIVKDSWIAHVRELAGLPTRKSWNRVGTDRQCPCPAEMIEPIMQAFRFFRMID